MMDALEMSDAVEAALNERIAEIYAGALKKAVKKAASFLKKVKAVDDGRITPPQYYVDTDTVDKWRKGYLDELVRQYNVIDGIMDELNRAGVDAAALIRDTMPEIYAINERETIQKLTPSVRNAGLDGTLEKHTKKQIAVILQKEESPFSKIAYRNLGQNAAVRRRLQNELAQATALGESQAQLIKRIMAVTGQAQYQAKRVAQTERTRVQSQARWERGNEAAQIGVRVYNTWSTRMVNSRDTHIALNGRSAMQGEPFPGSILRYPGDPRAPAGEVINCHCVLVPDVLMDGQEIIDGQVVG